jgi:hypothetical protein
MVSCTHKYSTPQYEGQEILADFLGNDPPPYLCSHVLYVCADAAFMQGKSLLLMKRCSLTPHSSPTRWNLSTSTCSSPTFSQFCPGASPCRPLKSTHASTSQSLPSWMVLFLRSNYRKQAHANGYFQDGRLYPRPHHRHCHPQ